MRNELINFSFNKDILKHFKGLSIKRSSINPVMRVSKFEDKILFNFCGVHEGRYVDLGCIMYDFLNSIFSFYYGVDEKETLSAAAKILENNEIEIRRLLNIKTHYEQLRLF